MSYGMKPIVWGTSLFVCLTSGLLGQQPAAAPVGSKLEFEVASVKPAAPMMGGFMRMGMRVDAGRMDYENVSLKDCIRTAYRLKDYQISGPDWMTGARFDIVAKLPEGATKDQVPEMLEALLADRFKIAVHHESKSHDSYVLLVGKSGPRLTPSAPDDKADPSGGAATFGTSGGGRGEASGMRVTIALPGGGGGAVAGGGGGGVAVGGAGGAMPARGAAVNMSTGGAMKMQLKKQTVTNFAETLARFLASPVVDLTEIQGTYDFALELTREDLSRMSGISLMARPGAGGDTANPAGDSDADPGSGIFKTVQNYGLKLDKRKAPMDLLVVDHIEKVPTEN
jgi:uncharacterized protein (TIGR03435 family)